MATAPATAADFVALARKSGLVDKSSLEKYLAELQKAGLPPDPSKLARLFVNDGLLTDFQAANLLRGRFTGFTLGRYKILKRIGAGGMGAVFLAEHTTMRRTVALKVLPPDKVRDPACLGRFHREAQAVAALNHPNIVRAYDVDSDGKTHFLVMEYVDGVTLQDVVQKRGPLAITRAADIIKQVAAGLDHAHRAGLVHRDIKPANILVNKSQVKILDMGLARFFNDDTDSLTREFENNAVLGTADYLSPEQGRDSHEVDIRSDIYSLGATFYFLLTGRPPFAGGNLRQKLLWHQMKAPDPVRTHRPEVPESLEAVIAKMMAKNAADRYQSPAEVVQALTSWGKDGPITAAASETGESADTPASESLQLADDWTGMIDTIRQSKSSTSVNHRRPDKQSLQQRLRRLHPWQLGAIAAGVLLLVGGIWIAIAANSGANPEAARAQGPQAPLNLMAADRGFDEIELTWQYSGHEGARFQVERANDEAFTQNRKLLGTVPPGTTRFTDTPLAEGLPFYYRVRAVIGAATSAPSNVASPAPSYGKGFNANGLITNGGATLEGTALRLTDATPPPKARSAFYSMPLSVQGFTTTFRFRIAPGPNTADGFTFCIQNNDPGIVGTAAGGLGYGTIAKSLAIKFDLWNNKDEGNNSTGLFINGAMPDNPGSINLTGTGVDLHSGNTYEVVLTYNKGSLSMTMTDVADPKKTFRTTFTIDIPKTVGGPAAYFGFTGGTSGAGAVQEILSWTYTVISS
jgi:serine/threonine protein kinase